MIIGGREAIPGGLENKRALIRSVPVNCDESTVGTFEYNGKFEVTEGKEFFQHGQLCFPLPEDEVVSIYDKSYRTLMGPCVAHTGLVYADNDQNVKLAFRRLTAVRKPEIPGYDTMLTRNQAEFFTSIDTKNFLSDLRTLYFDEMCMFDGIDREAEEHHDDPHIKRLLRINAWEELNETGERYHHLWLRDVLYKLKRDEIAKRGKVPRMIGDLGVGASLQGFMLTKKLKQAQDGCPLYINDGRIEFCIKPALDRLETIFGNLLEPEGKFYMVYFSDDSCFSFRHRGRVRYYNLDISKCDASHGPHVFEALRNIVPEHLEADIDTLIDQCRLPIRIVSKSDRRNRVVGHFSDPTLFSGSTLTTVINNLANTVIGFCLSRAVHDLEDRDYDDDELNRFFTRAIEKCGYIVTGFEGEELCRKAEDLQFLKYSPAMDTDGNWKPLLNLGVFLRASGSCKGDLPGRATTPIEVRAKHFQSSLINGMYPRSDAPLIRTMTESAGGETSTKSDAAVARALVYKVDTADQDAQLATHHFTDEAILARYSDLTPLDLAELREFSLAGVYEHCSAAFVTKILSKDYGLATLDWTPS